MTYENMKLEDIYLMVDCYNLIVANATGTIPDRETKSEFNSHSELTTYKRMHLQMLIII